MTWHAVLLEIVPQFTTLRGEPRESLLFNSRSFFNIPQPGEAIIFNDLIVDAMNSPLAIELHIAPADPVYAILNHDRVLETSRLIEHVPFPRIWFSECRSGQPLGLEAFGNLRLFQDTRGVPAIAFHWRQ